eukprot:6678374-Prymnesium_polylepis.1
MAYDAPGGGVGRYALRCEVTEHPPRTPGQGQGPAATTFAALPTIARGEGGGHFRRLSPTFGAKVPFAALV